jgi:hypothetical protein
MVSVKTFVCAKELCCRSLMHSTEGPMCVVRTTHQVLCNLEALAPHWELLLCVGIVGAKSSPSDCRIMRIRESQSQNAA